MMCGEDAPVEWARVPHTAVAEPNAGINHKTLTEAFVATQVGDTMASAPNGMSAVLRVSAI